MGRGNAARTESDETRDDDEKVSDKDPGWAVLRPLDRNEKGFVLAVLRGMNYPDAASANGWDSPLAPVKLLGRPQIRAALERLAPLLPDSRRAARILAPYLMADSVEAASKGAPGSRDIRRDLLSIAGIAGVTRSEHVTASLTEVLSALESRGRAGSGPGRATRAMAPSDRRSLPAVSPDTESVDPPEMG